MRLFISLKIPDNIRKRLYEEADNLEKEGLFQGKITKNESIHLTLKFLGEIEGEKIEEVKKKLREVRTKKFDVMLGNLGVFDEKYVRIIWAKLLNCEELQKEVDEKLRGLFNREERFMSHITIARVKSCKDKKGLIERLKNIRLDNLTFKVESFELMKSELNKEGARYEVLERFELT